MVKGEELDLADLYRLKRRMDPVVVVALKEPRKLPKIKIKFYKKFSWKRT